MQVARSNIVSLVKRGLKIGVAACALLGATGVFAYSQSAFPSASSTVAGENERLLLTSDEVTYNNDLGTVIARGAVQIAYKGHILVADQVEYNQKTGRMRAIGNVELREPSGNQIFADELDITDDFSDGFVNALRIETPDNTRIAAESAERVDGRTTTFNNGVYTACKVCEDNPDKPPLWQIKAVKIVQDGEAKTIRLEKAQFEFFGVPIAFLPVLTVPDHTVKRKSGFLFPKFSYNDQLGAGTRVPYYFNLSKHSDLTVTAGGYTKQGVLGEAEYRRRFAQGHIMFKAAGIYQATPNAFTAGNNDSLQRWRGLIATRAEFEINPNWKFGWDAMAQSDRNFGATYGIEGYNNILQNSKVYLTGLSGKNFFDIRANYFHYQTANLASTLEKQQAIVHPSFDYEKYSKNSVLGGQLKLTMNAQSLSRRTSHFVGGGSTNVLGLQGSNSRLTAELEWKKTINLGSGLLLTPILAARGDLHSVNSTSGANPNGYIGLAGNGTFTRSMVTAGLEARYPILASTENSTHIFEPIAQLFVRPNERYAGGLPNEDAQSFVFDTTTLFERDKFSGFDRIEGGVRANVGLRYTGQFNNGTSLHAIAGQSYHLYGINSFATNDLVQAGASSGLETNRSDYVASAAVEMPNGFSVNVAGRFDEQTFAVRRASVGATYTGALASISGSYALITPQPGYGSATTKREEVALSGRLNFDENWHAFGSGTYDLNAKQLTSHSIGLRYLDECFDFSVGYYRTANDVGGSIATTDKISATLTFRTLGDIRADANLGGFAK